MEGTHRKLGAWLSDRLGSNNTNRLADVYIGTASKISSVAFATDTYFAFACQSRTDFNHIDAGGFYLGSLCLINQLSTFQQNFSREWIDDINSGCATENTLRKRFNHVTALNYGANIQTFLGPTVLNDHNAVLSHVNQTSGQITRICSLKRCISKALASTVRRVEVLKDGQALFEV